MRLNQFLNIREKRAARAQPYSDGVGLQPAAQDDSGEK